MRINFFRKSRSGLTLIELMIAVALFTGVMVAAAALFSRSLERQNETIISKNLQEETSFVLQYVKKELNGAKENLAGCGACVGGEKYFCSPAVNEIYFRDADNVCTSFSPDTVTGQRLIVTHDTTAEYLTSTKTKLISLKFTTAYAPDAKLDRALLTASAAFQAVSKPKSAALVLQTSFTAPTASAFACGNSVSDRDGNSYATVQIGTQCWFAEGLRVKTKTDGTCINTSTAPPCADASSGDDGLGRSCANNDEANCTSAGALYTWTAAMDGSTSEAAMGLCPSGWHIPTDAQWHILEDGLKNNGETCDPSREKTYDCLNAGTRLSPSGDSNFNGIWIGYRSGGSSFDNQGKIGYFISSSVTNGSFYYYYYFGQQSEGTNRNSTSVDDALTLRCLKD